MDTAYVIRSVDHFLKENSFKKQGKTYYIYDDKAYYAIHFWSSGTLHCEYYVLPFFIPFEDHVLTYGARLSLRLYSPEKKRPENEEIEKWASDFKDQYQEKIEPFFIHFRSFLNTKIRRIEGFFFKKKPFGKGYLNLYPYYNCTPLENIRLRIWMYLYRGDLRLAKKELTDFEKELDKNVGYYIQAVIERERDWIRQWKELISQGKAAVKVYMDGVVRNTKEMLKIKEDE